MPAELDLVAEFGAARETVRQAVRLLVSRGLVEIVRGKGSYVRTPEEWLPAGE